MSDTPSTAPDTNALIDMPGKDRGEATANIYLLDGIITVHNADGVLLLKGHAKDGFWDSLWGLLKTDLRVINEKER